MPAGRTTGSEGGAGHENSWYVERLRRSRRVQWRIRLVRRIIRLVVIEGRF